MSITGLPGQGPVRVGIPIADLTAGMYLAQGILLALLERVKRRDGTILTKSGLMVGLGETDEEVRELLVDLHAARCDLVTIGQYLRPSDRELPVDRFVPPEQFAEYERWGSELGFLGVHAGPFVRSSYNADAVYRRVAERA